MSKQKLQLAIYYHQDGNVKCLAKGFCFWWICVYMRTCLCAYFRWESK